MDKVSIIIYYTMLFIGMLAVLFVVGRFVKKIPPAIVKKLNRISFAVALISGILALATQKPMFTYLLVASIVLFFMFFNYKEET